MKPPINVLALDGGGMRGLYSASLLECLAHRYSQSHGLASLDIGKGFDLILGTSTGAILATGLATGLEISKIKELYCEHGPRIFPDPMPPFNRALSLRRKLAFLNWCLRHAFRPGTDAQAFKEALTDIFGNRTLGEMFSTRAIGLCITATALHQHRPVVFKTGHLGAKFQRDASKKLVDLCLASAAAPVYLPLSESNGDITAQRTVYADGGLWANNPVVIGLTEALAIADKNQPIRILSVGTCPPASGENVAQLQRGLLDWKMGAAALELSMNAQAAAANEQVNHLVRQLRRHGTDVEVFRCHETPPSQAMASLIGLDRADAQATKALIQHGADDGTKAFQEVQQGSSSGRLIEATLKRAASSHQTNQLVSK
jgi:patatin-like phospholipase/acyl hydrolase